MVGLKIGWFQFNFENSDWNIARLINYKDIINEIENYVHVSKEDIHASEFFFLFLISGIDENYIAINRAYCYISNINFNNRNFIIYIL